MHGWDVGSGARRRPADPGRARSWPAAGRGDAARRVRSRHPVRCPPPGPGGRSRRRPAGRLPRARCPSPYRCDPIARANYRQYRCRRGRRFLAFVHARAGRPRGRPGPCRRPTGCGVRPGARRRHRRGALHPGPARRPCRRGVCSARPSAPCSAPRCSSAAWPAATWPAPWRWVMAWPSSSRRPGSPPRSRTTPAASSPRRSAIPTSRWSTSWRSASRPRTTRSPPSCCPGAPAPPWPCSAAAGAARPPSWRSATTPRHCATGSPYAIAVALRTLAATGTGDRRVALLRQARATLDGVPADRLLAQIDTDLAGALVLSQGADTTEALAMLRSCGALRRAPGAVAAAGPGTPAARSTWARRRSRSTARRWPR